MPTVEVPADQIQWPPKCCRCGSNEFVKREHTDDVVIRTILSVTQSRKITLNIPVCDRCARAPMIWFGTAIGLGGLSYLILSVANDSDGVYKFVSLCMILGVVAAIVGVRKKPIKILKYDEGSATLKIKIYNDEIASLVSKPPAPKQAAKPAAPPAAATKPATAARPAAAARTAPAKPDANAAPAKRPASGR